MVQPLDPRLLARRFRQLGRRPLNADLLAALQGMQRRRSLLEAEEQARRIIEETRAERPAPPQVQRPAPAPVEAPPRADLLTRLLTTQPAPTILRGLEWFRRRVEEPGAGVLARPLAGGILGFVPGEQEFERRSRELKEQGVGPIESARRAFVETTWPSVRLRLPFSVRLPKPIVGERKIQEFQLGVAGGLETLASPWNLLLTGIGVRAVTAPLKVAAKAIPKAAAKEMVTVPPLAELQAVAFGTGKSKVTEALIQVPGVRQAIAAFKPIALTGDDPIEKAAVLRGQMEDIAEAGVAQITMRARALSTVGVAGITRDVIQRDVRGVVTDPRVRQIKPLPGNVQSRVGHDIVEWADHYEMAPAQRALVDEIRGASSRVTAYLEKEGFDIPRIKGESDWRYLHRSVVTVKQDRLGEVARDAERLLMQGGQPFARQLQEAPWTYLGRMVAALQQGTLKATPELDNLVRQVAELMDVRVRRQALTSPRVYATAAEGLEAGVGYLPNPVDELAQQAAISYRMVIDKRIAEMLKPLTTTKRELVEPAIRQARAEGVLKYRAATRLSQLVNRASRGEKIFAASTIRFVRPHYPDQFAKLEEVMGLELAPRREALKAMRGEMKPLAAKARIASLETGARYRREALKAMKGEMKELVANARIASLEAGARYRRAMELVMTPERRILMGVRGLSGRVVTTQVIDGKTVLGRDIARRIEEKFGYMPRGFGEQALDQLGVVASIYRLGKASFDTGIQFITLFSMAGLDFYNLLVTPASKVLKAAGIKASFGSPGITTIWPQATLHGFWSFIDPKHEITFWLRPENKAALLERVPRGSLVQASEFTEGASALTRLASKIPVLGPRVLRPLARQAFGRADAAWSTARNVAANLQWKAYAPVVEKAAGERGLNELAKMTNLLSGVFSLRGMGTPARTRQILNAVGFFAPRYTFAQAALIGRVFAGGLSTKLALEAITGMIALNSLTFTLLALALGQKPKINPLPKRLGGDGADLWTVQRGNQRVGVGGAMYTPMRLIANVASDAMDEPDKLLRFDMSNPLVRFWRGKAAGPTAIFWDYVTGRDFIGEPVRGMGRMVPTAETLTFLKTVAAPIWAEHLLRDDRQSAGFLGAVAEWFGLRVFPVSFWEQYRALVELHSGKNFDELDQLERVRMEAESPDVAEARKEAENDAARRGWDPLMTEFFRQYDDAREVMWRRVEAAASRLEAGDPLWGIREVESLIDRERRKLTGVREAQERDPRFAEVIEKLERRDPSPFASDNAYRRYWSIFFSDELVDETGTVDYEARERLLVALRQEVGEETWAKVMEHVQLERMKAPRLLQERWYFIELIRPYQEVPQRLMRDRPDLLLRWRVLQRLGGEDRQRVLLTDPELATVERQVSAVRQQMRMQDAALDEMLFRWGRTTTLLHPENEGRQQEIAPWLFAQASGLGMEIE